MATYKGTSGNDTYTGGSSGDSITGNAGNDLLYGMGGNDTINGSGTVTTTKLDLNWKNQGSDGTNLANGFTQNTGGINVTVGYTDYGPAQAFQVETSSNARGYVASGETFDAYSNAYIQSTGTGVNSAVTLDFANASGYSYQDEVTDVSFRINDVDGYANGWTDIVTVTAYDAAGNIVPVTMTPSGADTVSGNTITASLSTDNTYDSSGSVLVSISGPVARIEITYANGQSNQQFITISDVQFVATSQDMDTIYGGDGNDLIYGGTDEDLLFGEAGNDTIDGGVGRDTIDGGAGNDSISGGDGNDSILGGTGNDTIDGGAGDDYIDGGDDNDSILGGTGNDTIYGGNGTDWISGGTGDDLISGGAGNDTISGGDGNDTIDGGTGADSIDGGAGDDSINGGDDTDTIIGGDGNDTIDGGNGTDSITGGAGNDVISGGAGNDTVYGGDGNDTINGGTGADSIDAGAGDDYVDAGDDNDTVYGGTGNDTVLGGSGNDSIFGDTGNDVISGGTGNDTLYGGDGNDTIEGGAGADSIFGDAGDDYIDGGDDNDTIYGGTGNDTILGGKGADSVFGGTGADVFVLNAGESNNDYIDGGEDNSNESLDTAIDRLVVNGRAKIIYDANDNESGTILWANGDTTRFTNIELITHVPCFTRGTIIETRFGQMRVEDIEVGHRVLTRDNGYQEVRWIGRRTFTAADLDFAPQLCPVRISAGALGMGLPEADLIVSPQHRIMLTGPSAEMLFGESEVLAAAVHLVGIQGVTRLPPMGVEYIHIMFEQHEIIRSDGAWTESFQPGDRNVGAMTQAARDELFQIFPELTNGTGRSKYPCARLSLKAHEVRVLMSA
ncbi:Hint domain-containing protein [Albirhodobacter sp. R86504]|uniref:Hint domain-containing protein n=1 Tax=Albirhodobacter sp. R86504 TaxID=3093848 RepID=UPI00366F45CF